MSNNVVDGSIEMEEASKTALPEQHDSTSSRQHPTESVSITPPKEDDSLLKAERKIAFIDAAIAIALTLNILPLLDASHEALAEDKSTAEWLNENKKLIVGFMLSFAIVSGFWADHAKIYHHVHQMTRAMGKVNFLFLLAITFVPVATNLATTLKSDRAQYCVYIGTFILLKISTIVMILQVQRTPNVIAPGKEKPSTRLLVRFCVDLFLLMTALGLSFQHDIGFYGLLLLLLSNRITWVIGRYWPLLKTM